MENTFFGRLLEVHKVQIAVNMCYLNVQIEQCLFFLSARKKNSRKDFSFLFSPAFPRNLLDIKRTGLELLKIIKKE